jgi:hypothetical protein
MSRHPAPDPDEVHPPVLLRVAAVLAIVQVLAGIVVVATGDRYGPGGRILVAGCLGLGVLFARSTLRLRAGGAFGLFVIEITSVLIALGATGWPAAARVGLAVVAVTITVLVLASLHAFPSPTVPAR